MARTTKRLVFMVNVSQPALISALASPDSLKAILICPTYRFLAAFPGRSHKVRFAVFCYIVQYKGFARENLPFRPVFTSKILPTISLGKRRSASIQKWALTSICAFSDGASTRNYNNSSFIASFSQSFLAVVVSLDPNATPDPENITPFWAEYNQGNTEMLFNETTSGQPDIRPFNTDPGLLERCRFVSAKSLPLFKPKLMLLH